MSAKRAASVAALLLSLGALVAVTLMAIWTVNHDVQNRLFATAGVLLGCAFLSVIFVGVAWTSYD